MHGLAGLRAAGHQVAGDDEAIRAHAPRIGHYGFKRV